MFSSESFDNCSHNTPSQPPSKLRYRKKSIHNVLPFSFCIIFNEIERDFKLIWHIFVILFLCSRIKEHINKIIKKFFSLNFIFWFFFWTQSCQWVLLHSVLSSAIQKVDNDTALLETYSTIAPGVFFQVDYVHYISFCYHFLIWLTLGFVFSLVGNMSLEVKQILFKVSRNFHTNWCLKP